MIEMEKLNFDNMMAKINVLKTKAPKANYKCNVCNDKGFVLVEQLNKQPIIKECMCRQKNRLRTEWQENGFSANCSDLTLNQFDSNRNKVSERMRKLSEEYVNNYEGIQFQRNNSIAFLGEPGAGKTHICVAISLELLKKGFKAVYFPYRNCMDELIDLRVSDKIKYETKLTKYQKCNILFLDDVFKGGYTAAELKLLYKIVNYRYINNLPMIISSECLSQNIVEIDKAIGSRIIEMSKGRILDIVGEEYNQRLI
jgi:DNA replication protein DnaC